MALYVLWWPFSVFRHPLSLVGIAQVGELLLLLGVGIHQERCILRLRP